jgi:MFS transporter, DHA1 family, solute carrier family 18 (vesicular amine transporter), member 1/2
LSFNLFNGSLSVYLHRDRGFSVIGVGFAVGITFAVQVVATLIAGPLMDRRGSRLALRLGPAIYLVAALAFLASADPRTIIAARILQGFGIALILPAAFTIVPTLVPGRIRGLALGVVGLFQSMAFAIGPQLGLWLLSLHVDLLFMSAALAAAIGLGFSTQLREAASPVRSSQLFKYRTTWAPILALTLLTELYWGVVVAYLPIHVATSQIPTVGWFFTADALGVLVCRLPIGAMSDRLSTRWLFGAGIVITVASIALIVIPTTFATMIVAGAGTGIGAGLLITPSLIELQNRSNDSDRGTAMALWSTSFAIGIGLGTIGAGPLVEHFGFSATMVASAVLCLAALPIAVMLKAEPVRN